MGTWDDIVDKNAPPPYWFEPKEKDEDELPDRRTRRRIEQHGLRQRLVRVLGAFREDCTVPGLKLVHPKTGQATTWRIWCTMTMISEPSSAVVAPTFSISFDSR